jgi:quaternary ammonium compound-resistance protein SugE
MGIIATTLCGVLLFKEILSPAQIICIVMIVAGIAGLKILGN